MVSSLERLPAVLAARGGVSKTKHYDEIKKGLWTPPVKLGPRLSAWPSQECEALNQAYIAGKSPDEIRKLVATLTSRRKPHEAAQEVPA